jgi:D-arabinose 1-dehydrogenase-like Zn-dependent alcohol dehydrogenase
MVGGEVTSLQVGDFVGVSPIRYSDMTCRYCTDKHESTNMCIDRIYLYGEFFGGYCTHVQINHNWAIKIPQGLHNRLHDVPPILCAGITVYAPIKRFLKPGGTCAVIGIGGLGHLGVQFANKLGMKVTAFTTRVTNTESLHQLGASDAQHSVDPEELAKNEGKYDLVISTLFISDTKLHALHQRLTKPGGTFVMVGSPPSADKYIIDNQYLVDNEITVAGSNVGSIRDLKDMLEFAAHYNVNSINEYYAFEDFNKAFARLEKETPRYRCVVNVVDWAKKHGFDK